MPAADADPDNGPGFEASAPPAPDAVLPALDASQVAALRELGQRWARSIDGSGALARLPVDASPNGGTIPGPVRIGRLDSVGPRDASVGELEATPADGSGFGQRVRRVLFGPALKSTAIVQERMRKLVALPVLSADALSSVAYGPESMLAILVLGGGAGLGWSLPISGAIAFLMLAVGLSYRQTIRAYPNGGGSYIVATDNLGQIPGLVAAAGLITDYVLTVTVSVASGLDTVSSAIPSLSSSVVPVGLGIIVLLLAANLRGVRHAGGLFAAPTYAFIVAIGLLVVVGLIDSAGHSFHPLPRPALHASQGVGLLLVLRAFSSGSTAMTGIEAISNAVPVFKPVQWKNARTSLTWMVGLLIAMFAGIIALVELDGVVPESSQTVLSQLAHRAFGSGLLYAYTQAATALVLLLAANTAYNDFPRVLFLLARDRLAPSHFLRMGDRLAFNNGIVALSVAAAVVFVAFGGKTGSLIPLYAVGVFLAFTLSQAGMVVHWWRSREAGWRTSISFNAVGCVLSAIVFVIAGSTKFTAGAWAALLIVVGITATALLIRGHYRDVNHALDLRATASSNTSERDETPRQVANLAIAPIGTLNLASMRALAYAASLDQPVLALHISPTAEEASHFREYWRAWGDHVPLKIVNSPYRAVVAPTISYIEALHAERPELTLTVVVPELIVRHWWQRSLHEHTAWRLRRALEPLPGIVVTRVPFHLPG